MNSPALDYITKYSSDEHIKVYFRKSETSA